MKRITGIGLFIILCVACAPRIDETNLKSEIFKYWNTPDIDDIAITDVSITGRNAKASASLVIFDDTLREHIYTFEKFRRSWKVTAGPSDEATRPAVFSYIRQAKLRELKENMYLLQGSLEYFAKMVNGAYPTDFDMKVKDLYPQCDPADSAVTIKSLFPPPEKVRNPYMRGQGRICLIRGLPDDWTWSWNEAYAGMAVYVPIDIKGKRARFYIIRGSTDEGWIALKLHP